LRPLEIAVFMIAVFAVAGGFGVLRFTLGAPVDPGEPRARELAVFPLAFLCLFVGSLGLLLVYDVHRKPTARIRPMAPLLLFVFSWFCLEMLFNFVGR